MLSFAGPVLFTLLSLSRKFHKFYNGDFGGGGDDDDGDDDDDDDNDDDDAAAVMIN